MLWERKHIQRQLRAIAVNKAGSRADPDDLYQEMVIHIWRVEQEKPDRTQSWYLKSCSFLAQDLLRKGRSVDSKKRDGVVLRSLDEPTGDGETTMEVVDDYDFRSELILKDTIERIRTRLTAIQNRILGYLVNDYSVTEIAGACGTSHQYISKERKKLAEAALVDVA